MNFKKIIFPALVCAGLCIHQLSAQVDTVPSPYILEDTHDVDVRLFDSDEVMDITLRFDITTLKRKKSKEEYLPAVLTYYAAGDSINKNIRVKARGEMRRGYCDFPPVSLNFKLKDSVSSEFDGIDKLKLVTYCKLGYEDYVLKEYLIYRLYNMLTENSLRVRLVRVTYINTEKEKKPVIQYGFVIEPVELLEMRTGTSEVKTMNLTQKHVDPEMMDRLAIFMYMIGNVDWAVPNLHNVILLAKPGAVISGLSMIVPYDFDYAGLVNTDYAVPAEALPIETVRDRYYLGVCRNDEVFLKALGQFPGKKEEFYKIINDFPYLRERSKKDMIIYLEGFFRAFDKRNSILYEIKASCKNF